MFLKHIMVGAIQTNCYLVGADTSRDCVVIDPGADAVRILQELKKYGKVLGGVLLTHGHFDHMGALQELVKDAEVPVYISIREKELMESPALNASQMFGYPMSAKADHFCKDGEMLTLAGLTFEVIDTPGHTAGSICLYLAEEKVLFSGDTLFEASIGRSDLPTGNGRQLALSIKERLYTLPDCTKVYPGHGGATDIAFEKEHNMYV